MAGEEEESPPPPRSLNQIFYPARSIVPSYFILLALDDDVKFEFRHQYVNMFPRFTNVEDTYLLLSDFEEVCPMMHFMNVLSGVIYFLEIAW